MTRSVWERVRASVSPGDELKTPGRGIPPDRQAVFRVVDVSQDTLTVEVGKSGFQISFPDQAFQAVVGRLSREVGTLRVAATHSNDPLPGSVDQVVRNAANWNLASGGYAAAILEHAGIVEYVMKGRQKHARLRKVD